MAKQYVTMNPIMAHSQGEDGVTSGRLSGKGESFKEVMCTTRGKIQEKERALKSRSRIKGARLQNHMTEASRQGA